MFGTDVWAWRNENFRGGDIFAAYLAGETFAGAGPIVGAMDLAGVDRVADIGGGHGGLLAAILRAHPAMRGILFDLPQTSRRRPEVFEVTRRVRWRQPLVGGDFIADIPDRGRPLYAEERAPAFGRFGRPRHPGKLPRGHAGACQARRSSSAFSLSKPLDDPSAVMLDLHMMVITGSPAARTLQEFEAAAISKQKLALSKVHSHDFTTSRYRGPARLSLRASTTSARPSP